MKSVLKVTMADDCVINATTGEADELHKLIMDCIKRSIQWVNYDMYGSNCTINTQKIIFMEYKSEKE